MRLLRTNKPIPSWYLKLGLDQGAYDAEKLIFLPGRSKPIRVPDLKLVGKFRRGERQDGTIAPPVARKPKPVPNAPGLYVPPGYLARQKAKSLSSAGFPAKE